MRTRRRMIAASGDRPLRPGESVTYKYAPVAQLDRVSGYEPEGREFESLRARHFTISNQALASRVAAAFCFSTISVGVLPDLPSQTRLAASRSSSSSGAE